MGGPKVGDMIICKHIVNRIKTLFVNRRPTTKPTVDLCD